MADQLIQKIFHFLVQLSHTKQHSKSIITVPKIIHLCDGLMASEQSPLTHCIPALEPIVENIFLARNKSNTGDMKELETTRDVVLSMLLRLYEFNEVIDLVILILDDSRYYKNSEKWLRWSAQVMDVILPMLRTNKIRIDCVKDFLSLRRLMFVVEPTVFDPIDGIILLLFQEPLNYDTWKDGTTRLLGKILIGLMVLSSIKEETLIGRINELKNDFAPGSFLENCVPTADPLNVLNNTRIFNGITPEVIFVRFIFKTLQLASMSCLQKSDQFLMEETSILLMYCIHLLQSGSHCKIALYAISNTHIIHLDEISENFMELSNDYPILTFLWCYLLTVLNYNDRKFWSRVTLPSESPCINQKILINGSVILFCDYMNQDVINLEQASWFLQSQAFKIVELCTEDPVLEFISSIHRNNVTSKIFIENLLRQDLSNIEGIFTLRILRAVEGTHLEHYGSLLKLLIPNLLISKEIAIARSVANLASRKTELLLTMSLNEVHEQLSKEDLIGILKSMASLKLIKKHEALASLLNKLCTQFYDITPLEIDQRRCVNSGEIKRLQIDRNWFLDQIKENCTGKETAQLLSRLKSEELRSFLQNMSIQKNLFRECLHLNEPTLSQTTVERLFQEINKIQVDSDCSRFCHLISPVTYLVESQSLSPNDPNLEVLVKFSVICLESIISLLNSKKYKLCYIDLALSCTQTILTNDVLSLSLNNLPQYFTSIVDSLFKLITFLLPNKNLLPKVPQLAELDDPLRYQLYILITLFYKTNLNFIPKFFLNPIRNTIISLARLPLVNSYILIPVQVWKSGWSPEPFTIQPSLPIEFLQEVEILEEYIHRINLLGWTCRQQFEETWMSLLSVLCASFESKDPIAYQEAVHASSLAVKAITALLVSTMFHPFPGYRNISRLMHVARDGTPSSGRFPVEKLKKIQDSFESKYNENNYFGSITNVFNARNLEKRFDSYSYGQVSVKYLWVATKTAEINTESETYKVWRARNSLLEASGLDVNSCLQFLLDYYTQILRNQSSSPLRFLHEIVRSTVIISDLFTDKSQFDWMLEMFLELSKVHTVEDELLHQYLIIGICKAVAVLTPSLEVYETIKKLIMQYLKSSFLPSRMACLYGLLYILEGCKLSNLTIGGISEEMQIILPCAIEYIQCNLNTTNEILKRSQEHTILVWSLAFFLIENVEKTHLVDNFVDTSLQIAFNILLQQKSTNTLQMTLMKGLERLIVYKNGLEKNLEKQIMSLALEKCKSDSPSASLSGIQLLLSCMYSECGDQLASNNSQTNPDQLVTAIERISSIFEYIKRGYLPEVEVLCYVLPDILNDFFSPSDILTKVIGEFLSPQQPHPKLLGGVVFRVFEKAIEDNQQSLLQDWVVFSLFNLTQSLSIGMATWCLTCFFVSASSNEWLRLFFPYILTRIGRYEFEDRRMLCIAGADFYRNLKGDRQKETFVENFGKVKDQGDVVFQDLLASL